MSKKDYVLLAAALRLSLGDTRTAGESAGVHSAIL